MTLRRNFVAPRTVRSFDDVQKSLQLLQETLDRVLRSPYQLPLATQDFTPLSPSFTRVSALPAGIKCQLPAASPDNAGDAIIFSLERSQGTFKVFAASQQKVNGTSTATFTTNGIVVLYSNGVDSWNSENQLPAESPTGAALSGGVILATANTALPQGRVLTDGLSNSANYAVAGSVKIDWLGMALSAGTTSGQLTALRLSDLNGVSFGLNGTVVTASVSTGLQFVATNLAGTLTQIRFGTNGTGDNVVFALSTGGGGAQGTFHATATVAFSAGTTSTGASNFVLADSNGVSFGLNGATVTATVRTDWLSRINVSVGTTSFNVTQVVFLSQNNVTFGFNGSSITGSAAVKFSAGTQSSLLSALTFADGGNVSFGLNAGTLTASVASSLTAIKISAGASSSLVSAVTFSNANGVSFGFDGTNITASVATAAAGAVTFSAGTSSAGLGSLVFSNSNGVSFGLNGSTLTGSHAVVFAAGLSTQSLSSLQFGGIGNVAFAFNASTIFANASMKISAGTQSSSLSAWTYSNSNNVSFGLNAGTITASVNHAVLQASNTTGGASNVSFDNGIVNLTLQTSAGYRIDGRLSGSDIVMSYVEPHGGWNNGANPNNGQLPFSFLQNTPFVFCINPQGVPLGGLGTANRVGDWHIGFFGSLALASTTVNSTVAGGCGAYKATIQFGLYNMAGGTAAQLDLINSCSFTISANSGTQAFSQLANARVIKFAESIFSVSSGFTRGEWYGCLLISQSTANDVRCFVQGDTLGFGGLQFFGTVGANGVSSRFMPMQGFFTATSSVLPVGIGSSNLQSPVTTFNASAFYPFVSVRPVMATGFR